MLEHIQRRNEVDILALGIDNVLKEQLADFSTGIDNSSKALCQLVNYLKEKVKDTVLWNW